MKINKTSFYVISLIVLLSLISTISVQANLNQPIKKTNHGYLNQTNSSTLTQTNHSLNIIEQNKTNMIIVFKKSINSSAFKNKKEYSINIISEETIVISATTNEIKDIKKSDEIAYIEEDFNIELLGISEVDSTFERQIIPWGISRINAPSHWENTKGNRIKIAILDSGVSEKQKDLDIAGGISFINNATHSDDDIGHGTMIAGVISALDNEIGVVGVAPEAGIYSVKIIGRKGGKLSGILQGIQWAIDNEIDIIVMSLGLTKYSKALEAKVNEAYENGMVLVAAAGKNGEIYYPAKYSSVIAVGAIGKNNEIITNSGIGSELELVAPGNKILSTKPNNQLGVESGSSLAAPHVAGIIALMKSKDNNLTPNEIRIRLQRDAIDLGDEGKDDEFGYGLVNINFESNPNKFNTTISIVFPKELNETKKRIFQTNPVKVEVIKTEWGKEQIIYTLFYNGLEGTYNISILPGNYTVMKYFEKFNVSSEYMLNEGDFQISLLYGDTPAHPYITSQARYVWADIPQEMLDRLTCDEWSCPYDTKGYNPGKDIIRASIEEDHDPDEDCVIANIPTCKHFWDPDNPQNGSYNKGIEILGIQFDSSYTKAESYMAQSKRLYQEGNIDESYYWLGRTAHLIEDMAVPAHVHNDFHAGIYIPGQDDEYEEFISNGVGAWKPGEPNIRHFKGPIYLGQQYNYETIPIPFNIKTNPSNLFKLYWYVAQKTVSNYAL